MSDWRSRAAPVAPQTTPPTVAQVNSWQQPAQSDWRSRAKPVQATSDWRARAKPVEPGFLQRVKNNYASREQEIQGIKAAGKTGNETGAETLIKGTAATASQLFVDPVSEALSTVTPDFVKKGVAGAVHLAGKLPSYGGGTIGEGLPKELDLLAKQYPRTAGMVKAGGQLLNLAGTTTGVAGASKLGAVAVEKGLATKGVQKFITDESSGSRNLPKPMTTKEAAGIATENYDTARHLGASFKPEELSIPFVKALKETMPKPIAGEVLTDVDNAIISSLKEYEALKGKTLTLDDLDRIDKTLGQKITKNHIDPRTGAPDAAGVELMKLQTKLRQLARDVPDTPGNEARMNGVAAWSTRKMMEDLDMVAHRASLAPGDKAKALQAGYRALALDADRIRHWPKEARALLEKAATPGLGQRFMASVAPRLTAIIMGASGNVSGALGTHIGGIAAQGVQESLVAARGAAVQRSLGENLIGKLKEVKVPAPDTTPLQLAAPGKLSPLPMSEQQINIARKLMSKPTPEPPGPIISETAMKKIPSPENMSKLPMSEQQVGIAQKLMTKKPSTGRDPSGGAVRTPASQVGKLEGSLKGIKKGQLKNMKAKLLSGELSQNKFVETAMRDFGLNTRQATDLAKEIKNYGEKK